MAGVQPASWIKSLVTQAKELVQEIQSNTKESTVSSTKKIINSKRESMSFQKESKRSNKQIAEEIVKFIEDPEDITDREDLETTVKDYLYDIVEDEDVEMFDHLPWSEKDIEEIVALIEKSLEKKAFQKKEAADVGTVNEGDRVEVIRAFQSRNGKYYFPEGMQGEVIEAPEDRSVDELVIRMDNGKKVRTSHLNVRKIEEPVEELMPVVEDEEVVPEAVSDKLEDKEEEKVASEQKKEAEDNEDEDNKDEEVPTKLKEKEWHYEKRPGRIPKEKVVTAPEASEEIKELHEKIEDSLINLELIKAAVDKAQQEFRERVKEIEEKAEKSKEEERLRNAVDKLGELLEATENRVVRLEDKVLAIERPTERFTATQTWKLRKLLERYEDAAEYLERARKGAQSLNKPAPFKQLLRWPLKESSRKTFSGIMDNIKDLYTSVENFLQEITNIEVGVEDLLDQEKLEELPMAASLDEVKKEIQAVLDKKSDVIKEAKTYEIYWHDLNEEAQEKLKELFHENVDISPIAVVEVEENDHFIQDDKLEEDLEKGLEEEKESAMFNIKKEIQTVLKESQETAEEAYKQNSERINKDIEALKVALMSHMLEFQKNLKNWECVNDLSYAASQIEEIINFLKGEDHLIQVDKLEEELENESS